MGLTNIAGQVVGALRLVPAAFTAQRGDQINDAVRIEYDLLNVTGNAEVAVGASTICRGRGSARFFAARRRAASLPPSGTVGMERVLCSLLGCTCCVLRWRLTGVPRLARASSRWRID